MANETHTLQTTLAVKLACRARAPDVKPPPFEYHRPATLSEALQLIATLENARVLAGGQSLLPMLNLRFALPDHIIDLNSIDELNRIEVDGDVLTIGAMARQRDIERSEHVRRALPLFYEALQFVGHVQTRNRGTIGGSLCHLDPSAELPAVVAVLDGEVVATSIRGQRTIAMSEFPAFHMTPAIETDEIVTAVKVPIWSAGHGYAFEEFARRHGDFAVLTVSALLETDQGARVTRVAMCVGGISHGPVRMPTAEAALLGRKLDEQAIDAAAQCCADIPAEDDPYNSAAYRKHLATGLAKRAVTRAYARAKNSQVAS